MNELDFIKVATDIKQQAEGQINNTIVEKEVELLMPKLLEMFQYKVDNKQFTIDKTIKETDSEFYLYKVETKFVGTALVKSELGGIIHKPEYAHKEQFIYVLKEVKSIFDNIHGYEAKIYEKDEIYHLDIILEAIKHIK